MLHASPDDLKALADVSDTALLTLFARAEESRAGGLIHDPMAEALADALTPLLADSARPIHQRLAKRKLPDASKLHLGLRARHFDALAAAFLQAHPGALIVSLGCGFDSRFFRLEAREDLPGPLQLLDVDLPPVIELKRRLYPAREGYRMLGGDVTELAWLDALPEAPCMVLAEGLLMYLEPEAVKGMVQGLAAKAPGSELVAEIFQRAWLEGWRGRMVSRKLEKNFDIGVAFRFGVEGAADLCDWVEGTEVLDEWNFFEEDEPRLWSLRWMRWFESMRRLQWVAHWRLGPAT